MVGPNGSSDPRGTAFASGATPASGEFQAAVSALLEARREAVVRSASLCLRRDAPSGFARRRARAAERVAEGVIAWMLAELSAARRGDRRLPGRDPIEAAGALLARRAPELSGDEIARVLRGVREGLEEAIREAGFSRDCVASCLGFAAAYFARLREGVRQETGERPDAHRARARDGSRGREGRG